MSAQDRALDWRRLNDVWGHVSWAQVGAARLSAEFSLNVDAFVVLVNNHRDARHDSKETYPFQEGFSPAGSSCNVTSGTHLPRYGEQPAGWTSWTRGL